MRAIRGNNWSTLATPLNIPKAGNDEMSSGKNCGATNRRLSPLAERDVVIGMRACVADLNGCLGNDSIFSQAFPSNESISKRNRSYVMLIRNVLRHSIFNHCKLRCEPCSGHHRSSSRLCRRWPSSNTSCTEKSLISFFLIGPFQ